MEIDLSVHKNDTELKENFASTCTVIRSKLLNNMTTKGHSSTIPKSGYNQGVKTSAPKSQDSTTPNRFHRMVGWTTNF